MSDQNKYLERIIEQLTQQLIQHAKKPTPKEKNQSIVTQKTREIVLDALSATQIKQLNENPQSQRQNIKRILQESLEHNTAFRRLVMPRLPARKHRNSSISVFISYRRVVSQDFVRHLAEQLNCDRRLNVQFDKNEMQPGPFPAQLGRLIRRCDVFLLVVQRDSLEHLTNPENWIRREIVTALEAKKLILPVVVDADEEFDQFNWPAQLKSVGELQAVVFKRDYFPESEKRLIQSILESVP